jgi:hypothetical protein
MNARLSPQHWSRRAYPVFPGTLWSENINRWAILLMQRKGAINPAQITHKIVQVCIVMLSKRAHLWLINFQGNPVPISDPASAYMPVFFYTYIHIQTVIFACIFILICTNITWYITWFICHMHISYLIQLDIIIIQTHMNVVICVHIHLYVLICVYIKFY